jgi:hypothetical protein
MNSQLEEVGVIPDSYRHVSKVIHSSAAVEAAGGMLKWYEIAEGDKPVPRATAALARAAVQEAVTGEALAGELGFVILHRCGEGFYFLLLCTWQNENELWETVWAKDGDADPDFHPWPLDGPHRPTFCVWELGAVAHERAAWVRFLRSARDRDARIDYLRDTFDGVV